MVWAIRRMPAYHQWRSSTWNIVSYSAGIQSSPTPFAPRRPARAEEPRSLQIRPRSADELRRAIDLAQRQLREHGQREDLPRQPLGHREGAGPCPGRRSPAADARAQDSGSPCPCHCPCKIGAQASRCCTADDVQVVDMAGFQRSTGVMTPRPASSCSSEPPAPAGPLSTRPDGAA